MKRSALVLLLLGSVNTGCFHPIFVCLPCGEHNLCPSGLTCNDGFCSGPGDVCAPGTSDGAIDGDGGKASICVGASCLDMPPGLVVWADRTSLPAENQPVTIWTDRSGNNHPVAALNPGAAPSVVGGFADIENPQSVLAVQDGTALEFDTSDFTIMVLARCDSDGSLACVFDDTTPRGLGMRLYCNMAGAPYIPDAGAPNRAQLVLTDESLAAQPPQSIIVSTRQDTPDRLHLYVARRTGDLLQLRIDGELQGAAPISLTTFNQEAPLFVGSCATLTRTTGFRGALGAVIVIEAALDEHQISAIETFVLSTMGPNAPPLP